MPTRAYPIPRKTAVRTHDRRISLHHKPTQRSIVHFASTSCGEKTRPGHCPERQVIAQRPSMINQAREVFCQGRFPASLICVLIVSPSPAVPPTFMPLPSRNTSAGRPVVLDTALLQCSFLPPSAKETRSDCFCPDGSAPRGNVRYIAATLAAATILQPGSASTDILL